MIVEHNVDMKKFTSFKAGGNAEKMYIVESTDELSRIVREIGKTEHIVLGNGTNTIVLDGGYRGNIIKLGSEFAKISVNGKRMVCGGAASLSAAAKKAQQCGLTGMEPISGIPGSIGGAVYMNAGAYGREIKDLLSEVSVVSRDGELKNLTSDQLELGYRHSRLMDTGDIVVSATFDLEEGNVEEIGEAMADFTGRRNSKQPVQYPSAGSFFKRPEGHFAGKLIEDAGLKGVSVGGAEVSVLHSGFLINKGGATATDILQLMRLVQNTVFDKFGVRLEPEVRIIGEEPKTI